MLARRRVMTKLVWVVLIVFFTQFGLLPPWFVPAVKQAQARSYDEDEYDEDEEDEESEEEEDYEEDTEESREDEEELTKDEEYEEEEEESEEEETEEAPPRRSRRRGGGRVEISGKVGCVVLPAGIESKSAAATLELAVRDWFDENGSGCVDILKALGGKHRLNPEERISKAKDLIDSAQEDYTNNDYDSAIEKLKEAEAQLRPVLNYEGALDLLLKALLLHGASLALNLDDEIALQVFQQALGLSPQLELPDDYPDLVRDVFGDARAKMEEVESGAVLITTKPDGARIYVDGQYRGLSPLSLENLTPGPHTVFAEATGFWETIKEFEVNPGEKTKLKLKLNPASDYPKFRAIVDRAARDFAHPNLYKQAKRMGRLLDTNLVMFLRVNKTGDEYKLKAYLYDTDEAQYKTTSTEVPKGVDVEEELGYLLSSLFSGETEWQNAEKKEEVPAGAVVIKETGEEVKKEEKKPFYTTWWFWTIVGGVVLAGAGAGVGTWLYLESQTSEGESGATLVIHF